MTELHLHHSTDADPTLPHQVIFSNNKGEILVSCNCRTRRGPRWRRHLNEIGATKNLDEARKLYNDPENHNKPFGQEDMAKW